MSTSDGGSAKPNPAEGADLLRADLVQISPAAPIAGSRNSGAISGRWAVSHSAYTPKSSRG